MNPLIQLKQTTSVFLIAFALTCFGFSPTARAVTPAPDGGYPGNNTAEGDSALFSLTNGTGNTAIGTDALWSNTTSGYNTAIGSGALFFNTNGQGNNTATGAQALFYNTSGSSNTANGAFALFTNTNGSDNTASGWQALYSNTTGGSNTAIGNEALWSNTRGDANTASGWRALYSNTRGSFNTATGLDALWSNTTGSDNTATGESALTSNETGNNNTATGESALESNLSGGDNVAIGGDALFSNENGFFNTAVGVEALSTNTHGSNNVALGYSAGFNPSAFTTGSNNVALGYFAGSNLTTGSHNIDIGAGINGIAGESNACRIGSIFGQTAANGSAVFITSGHKLGTATSSRRFKENINPMNKASEVIFSLKPVAFRYKKEIDPERIPQFGLVAEDVEKVNPDLIVRDKEGKPYSVRYDQVNAMLLNEFLKEHRTVQGQQKEIDALKTELKEQKALIQKVSAQIESSKPAPRVVNNP